MPSPEKINVQRVLSAVKRAISGRDPFNQNFGSVQPEKFRKNQSTFRGGPLFSVEPVRSKWTVPFDHSGPFSITGPRCLVTSKYKMEENTALLWVVDSGSIGVTRTYMYNYDRSVAASQAKCMFWLRICKFFRHSIRRLRMWCLKSHGKYLGTVCSK